MVQNNSVRVNIYHLLEDPSTQRKRGHRGTVPRTKIRKTLVDSKLISVEEPGWEEFSLTESVQHWLRDPESNYGVEISCDKYNIRDIMQIVDHSSANLDLMTFVHSETEESDNVVTGSTSVGMLSNVLPSLDVYSQERAILGRQKRAEERHDCIQGDGETRCCRYPLWVSFKDIAWDDWIVAPEGYQAYYCDGECPHRYKMAHTFAGIQSLLNLINPAAAPAPCCSATKLSPLSLLHYDDEGNLVVSVYDDMIVQECKCA